MVECGETTTGKTDFYDQTTLSPTTFKPYNHNNWIKELPVEIELPRPWNPQNQSNEIIFSCVLNLLSQIKSNGSEQLVKCIYSWLLPAANRRVASGDLAQKLCKDIYILNPPLTLKARSTPLATRSIAFKSTQVNANRALLFLIKYIQAHLEFWTL